MLSGAFLGLAFNTKMLEAFLLAPALVAAWLLGAGVALRRRLLGLAAAVGVALLVSLAWFSTMMLLPAGSRPYVGDSTNNSWFQLILGANGVKRVTGRGGAFGSELEGRLLRLFSHHVGGQIGWLIPLALLGMLGMAASWRRRGRSPAFGAYVLWSAWGLVAYLVFSLSVGVFHAYYTSVLAPPVATLAAAALVGLWRAARSSTAGGAGAGRRPRWPRDARLRPARPRGRVRALAALGRLRLRLSGGDAGAPAERTAARTGRASAHDGRDGRCAAGGPAAYSVATMLRAHTGYDPTASRRWPARLLPCPLR